MIVDKKVPEELFFEQLYSNRLTSTERFAVVSGTPQTTPYKTRTFSYNGRGNIKQDVRAKTGSPTYTLDLFYGNADRLDHVNVDAQ